MKRLNKPLILLVAASLAVAGLAAAAWAFWSVIGSGATATTVATLDAPANVHASFPNPAVRTVHVTWSGIVDPTGGTLDTANGGYYVERYLGTTPSPACGSSPASLLSGASVSCDDPNVPSGTYTYNVTAVFRSWTAAGGPSGSLTVPDPVLTSLAIGPATAVIAAGGARSYAATGTDQYGASMGDLTSSTTFTISPDGSCTAAVCTATLADTPATHHTVTGSNSGKTATASLTVGPAAASKLAFTPTVAGPGTAGSPIPNVAVSVEDAYGNLQTAVGSGSVVMSIKAGSPQAAFTSGTTTVGVVGGVATFSNLVVGTGGSYTFTATPSSISGVTGAVDSGAFIVSQAPAITSPNTTTFTTGSSGTFTVSATGFPAPTFSKTGTLPSGVTLSSAGVLSGTPAAGSGGTYPITITAANGVGSSSTQSFTLTVNQAPVITSSNTTTFTTGSPGTFTVSATGFPAPTFSRTGTLPSGVTLSSAGVLSGTPAAGTAGTYPLTITAANGVGSGATQSFTLTVVAGALTITSPTSSSPVTVTGGATQNVTVTGTNFLGGATVVISGGFTVNSVTVVSGTHLTVNVTAKNGNGNRGTYSLTVTNPGGVSVTSSNSIINA